MVSASADCARVLLGQLVAQGVHEVVLCPGSRSAPLALAAFEADAAGRLRLHVRTDERSACFLALGLAKASGTPAAVITTSGTAVGNLLPGVMEAAHAGVGLIVLTADRPAALVGFGANQTTDQVGLFGGYVRFAARVTSAANRATWAAQAAKAAVLAASGPVHLNVEFDVPLVPGADEPEPEGFEAVPLEVGQPSPRTVVELPAGPRTLIIAGDGGPAAGRAAAQLAAEARLPLVAEPSSNARVPGALRCGRLLLAGEDARRVQRVLVFGHPTLSRPVMKTLSRADVEVIAVGGGDWPDPGHRVRAVLPAVSLTPCDPQWLQGWMDADAEASKRVDSVVAAEGLSGWSLAASVWEACAGEVLVLGASQLARDADLAPIAERPPVVYANRGLAGIDGTVSTAAGLSLGLGRPVTLLCGDLTFLHDSNGLALGPGEPRPDLRIVVGDDSGGAIFATLEYGDARFARAFERVFATDPGVDLAALAASYGVDVRVVETPGALADALARPVAGLDVVIARLDRSRRRELSQRLNRP